MLDLNALFSAASSLSDFAQGCGPLAYVGMGPGPEFIPYFMALLGVVGAALLAVVQWPISLLLGRVKRMRNRGQYAEPPPAVESQPSREVGGEQGR